MSTSNVLWKGLLVIILPLFVHKFPFCQGLSWDTRWGQMLVFPSSIGTNEQHSSRLQSLGGSLTLWSVSVPGSWEPHPLVLCILENVSFLLVRRECKGHLFSLKVTGLFHRRDFLLLLSVSTIDSLEYFQVCVRACFPIAVFGSEESNLQSNISARPGLLSLSNLHSPISICPIFMGYSGKLQGAEVDLQKKMRLKYHCFPKLLHMILEQLNM